MYLKTLIPVNWGTLPAQPFEFLHSTLLTGPSGAGKSMLLDAMQTVFTAARHNVVKYNVAQSEAADVRSRSKQYRTLQGYVLGQVGSTIQRDAAHAWLAAVFAPDDDEPGNAFSAVVGATAARDGSTAVLNKLMLCLVRGVVSLDDLTEVSDKGVRSARSLKAGRDHLEERFGSNSVAHFADQKTDYLQTLYGWLEGRSHLSEREALASARGLVKSCAFRQVTSVSALIRDEILDPVDMGDVVHSTATIMRDIRTLADEAKRLSESIDGLYAVERPATVLRDKYIEARSLELAHAISRQRTNERAIERFNHEFDAALAEITRLEQDGTADAERLEGLDRERRSVQVRLESIPAAAEEARLKQDIGRYQLTAEQNSSQLAAAVKRVVDLFLGRTQLAARLNGISALNDVLAQVDSNQNSEDSFVLVEILEALTVRLAHGESLADLRKRLEWAESTANGFITLLTEGEFSLEHALRQVEYPLRLELVDTQAKLAQLRKRIAALDQGRIALPESVQWAVDTLAAQYPESRPQILADLIKPHETSPWLAAIEGFLGADRFAILVDARFETTAYKHLLRLGRAPGPRPKVLQVSRLMKEGRQFRPAQNSILDEIEIPNPVARAYLYARYGDVLKVASAEELRHVARGITLDGLRAGGFAVQGFDLVEEGDRVLGAEGRRRSLEVALHERDRLEEHIPQLQQQLQFLAASGGVLRGLRKVDLLSPLQAVISARDSEAAADRALLTLDLADVRNFKERAERLAADAQAIREQVAERNQAIGQAKQRREAACSSLDQAYGQTAERAQAVEAARQGVRELSYVDPEVTVEALEAVADGLLIDNRSLDSLTNKLTSVRGEVQTEAYEVRRMLADYNRRARPAEVIAADLPVGADEVHTLGMFKALRGITRQVNEQLRACESHALANIKDQLADAEAQFNSTFTTVFAQRMCNAIDEGVRVLRELNARLKDKRFGHDHYEIVYSDVAEYSAYARFFATIRDRSDELVDGQTIFDLDLPADLAAVRDELKELLVNGAANAAEKRLAELTDWRNYRTYDVLVTRLDINSRVKLSEWATGSGGENQTPYYVIRGAVLSSALRHGNDSRRHLSLMLLDEAFAAMDTERSRKTMELLRDTFGFQVICAMPSKSAGSVIPLFDREMQFVMVDVAPRGSGRKTTLVTRTDLKREAISRLYTTSQARLAADLRRQLQDDVSANDGAGARA